jgi:hypothetical protein
MSLDFTECDQARLARDAAYDGRFYTGVHTTGIYCRPICPVRPALLKCTAGRRPRFGARGDHRADAEAHVAGIDPVEVDKPLQRALQELGFVKARGLKSAVRVQPGAGEA